jgi:hypothetical protein
VPSIRTCIGAFAVSAAACAGTFGSPPAPADERETGLEAVIPPDFDELPRLDLEWTSADPDVGALRGILPSGEVVGGRVLIRELQRDTGELDTGVTERGFESGAGVFSPFPERWPERTNNVLNPSRSSRAHVTLGTETGELVECDFLLNDLERGFLGGARGVCVDADGTRYRTFVSR